MDHITAKQIVGSDLGEPSKMPGYSLSLDTATCITGSRLAEVPGSVCYKCYAFKGNYRRPNVIDAQARRLEGLTHPQWVEAMVFLINRHPNAEPFFRWHDSGDLQSVSHLENIAEVARQLPKIKFWLPTREYKIVTDWFEGGAIRPKNLIIRLSGHMVDGPLPTNLAKRFKINVSGVHQAKKALGTVCEARKRGNICGPCRACWDSKVFSVSYPKH